MWYYTKNLKDQTRKETHF